MTRNVLLYIKDILQNMPVSSRQIMDVKVLDLMSGCTDNALRQHGALEKRVSFIQKPSQ
jgi:hypothetical protein